MCSVKYRIALLTDGVYPMVMGGMQKHSYYLLKYLSQRGVGIDLYHPGDANLQSQFGTVLSSEELSNVNEIIIPFPKPGFLPGHYLKESFEYSQRLADKVIQSDVSFVYAKGFTAWVLLERRKKEKFTPKIGVNFHGLEMFQPTYSLRNKLESGLLKGPARFNVKQADFVFSYGGKISSLYLNAGAKPEAIVELPSGVEKSSLFDHSLGVHNPRRFVFVGRYERRKGIEELTESLKSLIQSHPNIQMDFIGPIPKGLTIEAKGITYHGIITQKEKVLQHLRSADVLVCPSYTEGMPNTILEAMSQGLCVIATDVGAINLLVNDKTGWLLPELSVAKLTAAMREAIEMDEASLLAKKKAAFEKISNEFTWEQIADKTVQFLNTQCIKS